MAPDEYDITSGTSGSGAGTADIADVVSGDQAQVPEEQNTTSIRLPERIDNKYVKEALKVLGPIAKYAAINYPEEAPNAFVKNSLSVLAALEEERKRYLDLIAYLIKGNTYLEGFAAGFKFLKDVVEGIIHYVPESKENPLRFAKTHLEQELGRNGFLELAKSANFDKVIDVMVKQTIAEVTGKNTSPENLTEDAAKLVNARLYARLKAVGHILGEKGAKFDQAGNGFLETPEGPVAIRLTDYADFLTALGITGAFEKEQLQHFIVEARKESTQYLKDKAFGTTLDQAGLSPDQFRHIMDTVLNGSVANEETILGIIAGVKKMQSSANFHIFERLDIDKALNYIDSIDIAEFLPSDTPGEKIVNLITERDNLIEEIRHAKINITSKDSVEAIATLMNLIENEVPAFCKKMGIDYLKPEHFFEEGAYEMIKVLRTDAINSAIEKAIDGFEFPQTDTASKELIAQIREQKQTFLTAAYNSNEHFEGLCNLFKAINGLKTLAEQKLVRHVDPLSVLQAETDTEKREVEGKTYPPKATVFIASVANKIGFETFGERIIDGVFKGKDVAPHERSWLQNLYHETRFQQGRAWWKSILINPLGAALGMGAAHIGPYIAPKNNIWDVGQVMSPIIGWPLAALQQSGVIGHLPVQSLGGIVSGTSSLVGGMVGNIPLIGTPIKAIIQTVGGGLGVALNPIAIGIPDISGISLQNAANMKKKFWEGLTGANTNQPIKGQEIHYGRAYSEEGIKLANEKPSLNPFSTRQKREEELNKSQITRSKIGETYLENGNPGIPNITPPTPTPPAPTPESSTPPTTSELSTPILSPKPESSKLPPVLGRQEQYIESLLEGINLESQIPEGEKTKTVKKSKRLVHAPMAPSR